MILQIENLVKKYYLPRSFSHPLELQALRGISLAVRSGETLAVVGESGCGKSTLAKVLMKLEPFEGGKVLLHQRDINTIGAKELSSSVQMVFQDPSSSLNPRKRVFDLIAEPLKIQGRVDFAQLEQQVHQVAKAVGVNSEFLSRYPHMMSGGQRQRVGIARALITSPGLIICDEPVSALDVSVQAQVLNLLLDLRQDKNLSYLFISHDLSVVRFIADRVAVLYLGRIVELASKEDVFKHPLHPYTRLLLDSAPSLLRLNEAIETRANAESALDLPSPLNPPLGCAFASRCPYKTKICHEQAPELETFADRQVACHHLSKLS